MQSFNDYLYSEGLTQEANNKLLGWLLSMRLHNYGYDLEHFNKLVRRASYLRGKLKRGKFNPNPKGYGILNRLVYQNNQWEYHIGQSFNEEYITLLECFTILD